MRKKIICFDIDGIICKSYKGNYKNSKPILKNISLINKCFKEGHFINLFLGFDIYFLNKDNKIEKIFIPGTPFSEFYKYINRYLMKDVKNLPLQ